MEGSREDLTMASMAVRGLALLLIVLLVGCATLAPVTAPPGGKTKEQVAKDRAECSEAAAKTLDSSALAEGARYGALTGAYLMLLGASNGAYFGALNGAHGAGEGAWIGAAAGAGIGLLVGLAVGINKGIEEHRRYQSAYEGCLRERGPYCERPPFDHVREGK